MSDESAQLTWVITREVDDADADVKRLREAGVLASAVPCIEFLQLAWPTWPEHRGTTVYFLTSRRAATALPTNENALIAAMAPATANFLRERGRKVDIEARGGAEALACAVFSQWERQMKPTWNVRYPTSDLGEKTPEHTQAIEVLRPIGNVERSITYQTRSIDPVRLRAALLDIARGPWNLTFASPSAVMSFLPVSLGGIAPPQRVVCSGASTFRAWVNARPQGWPHGEQTLNSIVDTLLSLEGIHHET